MNKAVAFAPSIDPLVRPFLPQVATLEGTVLVTETGFGTRRCDLATAESVKLGFFPVSRLTGGQPFVTLQARQGPGDRPVRLLIQYAGGGWVLVTPEHLRLLAQIISAWCEASGQPGRKAAKVSKRLREIADVTESYRSPVDWSFRTDPTGTERTAPWPRE